MCILFPDLYNNRMDIVALPICQITLKAQKPSNPAYPLSLISIGDHIKKKRLDLHLFQKDVAELIGVQTDSIVNWERNRFSPQIHQLPKVIEFLGYMPFELPKETMGDKIKSYRKEYGLTQRKLAKILGVDQTTIRDWERNKHKPSKKMLRTICKFII